MNSFINNLVSRHVETGNHVKPRLRGKFEPPAIVGNASSPDFNNDSSLITNNTTEPQIINPGSKPLFPINDRGNVTDNHPVNLPEQKPSVHLSAEGKKINADNEQPWIQPSLSLLSQSHTQLSNDNAPATKLNDTTTLPEINRVLKDPQTGQVISGDKSKNRTVENSFKNDAAINHQNTNGDIQTNLTSANDHWAQSKLTGQVLPADLKWLKMVKQDFNNRNGIQNNQSSMSPVIKVTIGKIEVRAVNQSAPVQTRETPKPRMTLDDFLKQRNGGKS